MELKGSEDNDVLHEYEFDEALSQPQLYWSKHVGLASIESLDLWVFNRFEMVESALKSHAAILNLLLLEFSYAWSLWGQWGLR